MRNRERLVVYGSLIVLAMINFSVLLGRTGTPAFADEQPEPSLPVSALTLLGADGAKDVVVSNRNGRIAWGAAPHDRVHSVAYVYIGKVLRQLMASEALQEDREVLLAELNEKETEYREKLDAVGEQLQQMPPDSPEAQQAYQEGSTMYQEYMAWQQEAMVRRGKMDAEHLERAYRELIEAVQVVGDRKEIDTIYRFIPTEEPFESENPEQAMMSIRLRTALRYPEDLDITDDVLEELSLEVE